VQDNKETWQGSGNLRKPAPQAAPRIDVLLA